MGQRRRLHAKRRPALLPLFSLIAAVPLLALFPSFASSPSATAGKPLPGIAAILILAGALLTLGYFSLPKNGREKIKRQGARAGRIVRRNADVAIIVAAIIFVFFELIFAKPRLTAGTLLAGTPTLTVPSCTIAQLITVSGITTPGSNTGGANPISCQLSNDGTVWGGSFQCCASGCTAGSYACANQSWNLSTGYGAKIVYIRCYDANAPTTYRTNNAALNPGYRACCIDADCVVSQYCPNYICTALGAPTIMYATSSSDKALDSRLRKNSIAWTGFLPEGYEYLMEQTNPSTAFLSQGSSATYTHDNLIDNEKYCYHVRVQKEDGTKYSVWSPTICARQDTPRMVLNYPFDEKSGPPIDTDLGNYTLDATGTAGNLGFLSGAEWSVDQRGFNSGMVFNRASTNNVSIATPTFNSLNDHTVSFWFYMTDAPDGLWRRVLAKTNGTGERSPGIWVHTTTQCFHWKFDPGNLGFSCLGPGGENTAFALKRWYHVAVAKSGTTATAYIDGAFVGTAAAPATMSSGAGPFYLGAFSWGRAAGIILDNVHIYDRPLNQQEVIADMQDANFVTPDRDPPSQPTGTVTSGASVTVNFTDPDKIIYYDARYPKPGFSNPAVARTYFVNKGFTEKNADTLATWMQNHITLNNATGTVVIMTDGYSVPDTIHTQTNPSSGSIVRQYVDSGGLLVAPSTPGFWYRGRNNGTQESLNWGALGHKTIFRVGTDWNFTTGGGFALTQLGAKYGMSSAGSEYWTELHMNGTYGWDAPLLRFANAISPSTSAEAAFKNFWPEFPKSGLITAYGLLDGNYGWQMDELNSIATTFTTNKYALLRSTTAAGTYIPTGGDYENFTGTQGADITTLSGWTKYTNGNGSTFTIDQNRFKFYLPGTAVTESNEYARFTLASPVSGRVKVEYDIVWSGANSWNLAVRLLDSTRNLYSVWSASSGAGNWNLLQNDAWEYYTPSTPILTAGQTYHFSMILDFNDRRVKHYLNDILLSETGMEPWTGNEATNLKYIFFANYGYATNDATYYIDNLRVTPLSSSNSVLDIDALDYAGPAAPTSPSLQSKTATSCSIGGWSNGEDRGTDYFFIPTSYDDAGNRANYLSNGGFERGNASWSGFGTYGSINTTPVSGYLNGYKGAYLKYNGGSWSGIWQCKAYGSYTTPRNYTASFMYKCPSGSGSAHIFFGDSVNYGKWTTSASFACTGNWEPARISLFMDSDQWPTNGSNFCVYLYGDLSTGGVNYDNVEWDMVRIGKSTTGLDLLPSRIHESALQVADSPWFSAASYNMTGLSSCTTYNFQVQNRDIAFNAGSYSGTAACKTLCSDGQACTAGADCTSGTCVAGTCRASCSGYTNSRCSIDATSYTTNNFWCNALSVCAYDWAAPNTTISSPSQNAYVSGTVQLAGTTNDTGGSGIKNVTIYTCGQVNSAVGTSTWTYNFDSRTRLDGPCTLSATGFDNAINAEESYLTTNSSEVLYMNFNEGAGTKANDLTMNSTNNGTITGGMGWDATGYTGAAADFTGTAGSYINVTDKNSLDFTGAMTATAWVNLGKNDQLNGAAIFAKGNGGGESYAWDFLGTNSNDTRFYAWISAVLYTCTSSNWVAGKRNTWQFLAATYNGPTGTVRLYSNGTSIANCTGLPASLTANAHEFTIGNRQSASTTYDLPLNASVDDLRLYSRALSQAEIKYLYYNATLHYNNTKLVVIDNTPPTTGSLSYTNGYVVGLPLTISSIVNGTDSGSGVANTSIWRQNATLSAGACGAFNPAHQLVATNPGSSYNDGTAAGGYCYNYTLFTYDRAGLSSQYNTTNIAKVDVNASSMGTIAPAAYYTYTTTCGGMTYTNGTDAQSGIAVAYMMRGAATLTAGSCGSYGADSQIWTNPPTPFSDGGRTSGNCYRYAIRNDNNAGLTNYSAYSECKVDTTNPVGGSISYPDGYFRGTTIHLAIANGTDAESAISLTRLWRQSAALAAGSCGSYGAWTVVATNIGADYGDPVSGGYCYNYTLQAVNGAGNSTNYTSAGITRVDSTGPTSSISSPTEGQQVTDAFTISGTASDTGGSGLTRVWVSYDGGETWDVATGSGSWTYGAPAITGMATILSMAEDAAGNNESIASNAGFESFTGSAGDSANDTFTGWSFGGNNHWAVTDLYSGLYSLKLYGAQSTLAASSFYNRGYTLGGKTFYFSTYAKATSPVQVPSLGLRCNGTVVYNLYMNPTLTASYARYSLVATFNPACNGYGVQTFVRTPAAAGENVTYDDVIVLEGVNVTGMGATPQSNDTVATINGGNNINPAFQFPMNLTIFDHDGGSDLDCDGTYAKCNVTCWSTAASNEGGLHSWDNLNASLANRTPGQGIYLNISAMLTPYVYSINGTWNCRARFRDKAGHSNTTGLLSFAFNIRQGALGQPSGSCAFSGLPGTSNISSTCYPGQPAIEVLNLTTGSNYDRQLWINQSRLNWTQLPEPSPNTFLINETTTFGTAACPQSSFVTSATQKIGGLLSRGTFPNPANASLYLCLSLPAGTKAGTYYTNFTIWETDTGALAP